MSTSRIRFPIEFPVFKTALSSSPNIFPSSFQMIEEESFDVVIMDFMMPALDGFEALKLMKAKQSEVQIILLTGNASDEKRMEAKALGALDVIEKPPDLKDLIQKIKKAKKAQRTVRGKKGRKKK